MPLWAWGLAGGAAVELLRWYRIREQLHLGAPDWAKSPLYWLVTIGMVAAGGCLVVMYQETDARLNSVLAFNIGASAPLIISTISSLVPPLARVDS